MYTKNDSIYNSKSQKITKTYILFLDALHNSYGIRKKKIPYSEKNAAL